MTEWYLKNTLTTTLIFGIYVKVLIYLMVFFYKVLIHPIFKHLTKVNKSLYELTILNKKFFTRIRNRFKLNPIIMRNIAIVTRKKYSNLHYYRH